MEKIVENDHLSVENGHVYEGFPFEPYPQQKLLMEAMYRCMKVGNVGFFESPTGTGKSLSTLFAAMTWLVEEEHARLAKAVVSSCSSEAKGSNSSAESDWWLDMFDSSKSAPENDDSVKKTKAIEKLDQLILRLKSKKGAKLTGNNIRSKVNDIAYESLTRTDKQHSLSGTKRLVADSIEVREDAEYLLEEEAVLPDDDNDSENDDKNAEDEFFKNSLPQIIYCSRTHSQLSQFMSELKRIPRFADARVCVLGGRKSLCLNTDVRKLSSDAAMTDTCIKLQKNKTKSNGSSSTSKVSGKSKTDVESNCCSYKNANLETALSEHLLANVLDIEDLASAGMKLHACPYYASRKAVQFAQVICMPYNFLLSEDIRESVGLNLRNRAIIIDEAHNIVDTCNSLYSAELSLAQLQLCKQSVDEYLARFQSVLNGSNSYNVLLLRSVVSSILKFAKQALRNDVSSESQQQTGAGAVSSSSSDIMTVNDFVFSSALDNVNLLKLRRYLLDNNVVNKIAGFMEHSYSRKVAATSQSTSSSSSSTSVASLSATAAVSNDTPPQWNFALRSLLDFIRCLTATNSDGRIVVYRFTKSGNEQQQQSLSTSQSLEDGITLKYVCLNPSIAFESILREANSICLIGGTMQPFDYYASQLFPSLHFNSRENSSALSMASRIELFACGHIVHPSNIMPLTLSVGPTGKALLLTHQHRADTHVMDELFQTLLYISRTVPKGIVVFFTSYAYLELCINRWKTMHMLAQLEAIKHIFTEPKTMSECETVLTAYANAIKVASHSIDPASRQNGAILFSVMGGKLSEGINFSDDLARCVCVVGLPYPDKRDKILQLKLNHYNTAAMHHQTGSSSSCSNSNSSSRVSAALYDVLCMRSVNQSIGRSIRHANDYSAMVLIDSRFAENGAVKSLLPNWIRDQLQHCDSFGHCLHELNSFVGSRFSQTR